MKIAILTVPFNNNYGGFLQAYALKKVLEKNGHSVEFLMRRRCRPNRKERIKNFIKWMLNKTNTCFYLSDLHIYRISKETRRFIDHYLKPISYNCYTSESFKRLLKNHSADVYIAGSDQCWRYKFAPGYIDDYFFKALLGTKKRRISYAASFGVDTFEYDEKMRQSCECCLKEFDEISVRESSGIRILEDYFHVPPGKAQSVLDPTMLLPINHYKELIDKYSIDDDNYMFTYILDKTDYKELVVQDLSGKLHLKIINQKAQTGNIKGMRIIEPIELWLSRIFHSSFVLTDSFHGMVFSIIFNKPFLIFGNQTRGNARFESLLSLFGLENRFIDYSCSDYKTLAKVPINWNAVNLILDQERLKSMRFLINAIDR